MDMLSSNFIKVFRQVHDASTNELDYLRDAQKMKIVLINQEDGTEIVQTVGLEAMGDDSEFGLRSDKLQLMAGTYQIIGFYLYKADGTTQDLKQILSANRIKDNLTVVNGGLAVQDIQVKVVNRGIVKFTITEKISTIHSGNRRRLCFLRYQIHQCNGTGTVYGKKRRLLRILP